MTERRFPPPWSFEEYNDACFIVRDHNGQALAYVYFEVEPGRRSAAKLLTRDEARRIAAIIAKLPELFQTSYPIKLRWHLNFGQSRAQYSPEGAAIKPRSIC